MFSSEGFAGAIALFVDFNIVYDEIKNGIENERNFENGCTSKIILPDILDVCILKNSIDNTIVYSRFEIIKYMRANTNYKDIKYYGVKYDGSPSFNVATNKI